MSSSRKDTADGHQDRQCSARCDEGSRGEKEMQQKQGIEKQLRQHQDSHEMQPHQGSKINIPNPII